MRSGRRRSRRPAARRPQPLGERLTNHRDWPRTGDFALVHIASAQDRDAHRLEVVGGDEACVGADFLSGREAGDGDHEIPGWKGHRQEADVPGGRHARKRARLGEHSGVELAPYRRRGRRRQRRPHRQHTRRIEAGVDVLHPPHRLEQQSCRDQRYGGRRDLCDDEAQAKSIAASRDDA